MAHTIIIFNCSGSKSNCSDWSVSIRWIRPLMNNPPSHLQLHLNWIENYYHWAFPLPCELNLCSRHQKRTNKVTRILPLPMMKPLSLSRKYMENDHGLSLRWHRVILIPSHLLFMSSGNEIYNLQFLLRKHRWSFILWERRLGGVTSFFHIWAWNPTILCPLTFRAFFNSSVCNVWHSREFIFRIIINNLEESWKVLQGSSWVESGNCVPKK